jgi:hypothetical protein
MYAQAYDIECLPNFFSITFVNLQDYFIKLKCVNEKGKPIPLTDVMSVAEIKDKLASVETTIFYMLDKDTSQLFSLMNFLSSLTAPEDVVVKQPNPTEDDPNAYDEVNVKRAKRTDLYGFNNREYDDLMLAAIYMYFMNMDKTPFVKYMYNTNKHIQKYLDDRRNNIYYKDEEMEALKHHKLPFITIDLMKVFALDKQFKSLKQTSINLKWYELLEYQLPPIDKEEAAIYRPDVEITDELLEHMNDTMIVWDRHMLPKYLPDMLHYNPNDVYIVCEMARLKAEEIRSRYRASARFHRDLYSTSRSTMSDTIISLTYSQLSGMPFIRYRNLKTERNGIKLADVIFGTISYQTEYMNDVLSELRKDVIFMTSKEAINKTVTIGETSYTLASGGLHSQETPGIFKADDKYFYKHWDAKSYYPSILIKYRLCPAHLVVDAFIGTNELFRDFRVAFKDAGDNENADIYKIVINSLTGKLNDVTKKTNWLLDALAYLRITINGQLMLLMAIEDFELHKFPVISGNTDGLIIKIERSRIDEFDALAKKWCDQTGMKVDSENLTRYIRRDVNCYIAVEDNGKIDSKNALNPELYLQDLTKGYNMPIVAKAVHDYFVKDIDPVQTLRACTNILDFCKTQNVNHAYKLYVPTVKESGIIENVEVQRNTRYYVSQHGSSLLKIKDGKANNLVAGYRVTVLNTLDDTPIEFRDINYNYYYQECEKLITPIKCTAVLNSSAKYKKIFGMYNDLFDSDNYDEPRATSDSGQMES